jgi:hypothetical protein
LLFPFGFFILATKTRADSWQLAVGSWQEEEEKKRRNEEGEKISLRLPQTSGTESFFTIHVNFKSSYSIG